MLINQTITKLNHLKLYGMAQELSRQIQVPDSSSFSFEERFSLIVDMEETLRDSRRLTRLLKGARLRENACIEDIDFQASRGLDRSMILSLATCDFVLKKRNILITGPTGVGKTFIACALAHAACRKGYSGIYYRTPRLLSDLKLSRADGSYSKVLNKLAKTEVLILDDFGINALAESERRDLLEVIEDRYKLRSTIIVAQVPVDKWYEIIGNSTIADAILDRLVHNAYRIDLRGGSMRKAGSKLD